MAISFSGQIGKLAENDILIVDLLGYFIVMRPGESHDNEKF